MQSFEFNMVFLILYLIGQLNVFARWYAEVRPLRGLRCDAIATPGTCLRWWGTDRILRQNKSQVGGQDLTVSLGRRPRGNWGKNILGERVRGALFMSLLGACCLSRDNQGHASSNRYLKVYVFYSPVHHPCLASLFNPIIDKIFV